MRVFLAAEKVQAAEEQQHFLGKRKNCIKIE
jgi:hypothetical protein